LPARLCRLPALFVVLCATIAFAEGTRTWEQSKFDDLSKGTPKGVAIRSAGGLELAPAFKPLATTPSTYIWALASDKNGNVYAAAGSPARVYRVTPDGQSTVIFEPQELQVQALAVDKSGALYAGTNPDGKVYRLEPGTAPKEANGQWKSSVYFDPATKYIWDLALDDSGNLYVATGDKGEIYRVTPKGEHSVFFKSDEAHIRVLALDLKGNLIAGSDGSGLVYRISPAGEAFVLYSAAKKEITALAVGSNGNIYAAGVGEKHSTTPTQGGPITPVPTTAPMMVPGQSQPTIMMGNVGPNMPRINFPMPQLPTAGGSEIYCIAPDGSPSRIWNSRDDLVYALAFDSDGHLLAGTGNDGHIYAIAAEDQFTDLLHASASQVTAFAKAPGGGLYVSTSNLGKLFRLGPAPEPEGTYESDVFDAHIFSRWGRAEIRSTGNVELFARSGNVDNPDRNWSPWTKVDSQKDAPLAVPSARFVQWKAVLHTGNPAPRLDGVVLNYLSRNVAPDFDDVSVQPGVRYQAIPKPVGADTTITSNTGTTTQPRFEPPPVTIHDSDSIGVKWTVHDDNDDDMVYSLYYKGDSENRWLLLKDQITDKFYAFDASLLPDGGYTVKIVASDAPSHSPGDELTSERESPRFEVDTTPPRIEDLAAVLESGNIHVSFRAADSFSPIHRAEYSVDAGDWQYVDPADQLSDSKTESYDFKAPVASNAGRSKAKESKSSAPVEHVVVVRAYDRYDNMVSAKTVIR
jgi:outer membrane protein assembly factor BamB